MKKSLLCLSLGLLVAGGVQAQTYVNEDFNSVTAPSLPTNWVSSPSGLWQTGAPDNIIPNAGTLMGLSLNTTAHMNVVGLNGNTNANNAILETPSFSIPSSVTTAYLNFDMSYLQLQYTANTNLKEDLYLMSSTDNGATWTTVQEIAGNQGSVWESRSISLASFAGSTNLRLGFKYTNSDTVLMGAAFDNIKVLVPVPAEMALLSVTPQQGDANAYGGVNSQVTLTGTVQNNGSSPITSYTVYYQEGSNTPVATQETANIAAFQTSSFSNVSYTVPSVGTHNLKVWIELSGDTDPSNDSATAYVEGVSFSPVKHLVFEEATGTWCGWCPRGSYNMKVFRAAHPGSAAQIAVHDGDPMTITSYDALITSVPGFSGFPSVVVDRSVIIDPGDMETTYQQLKHNFGFAGVTMGTPSISGNSVSVSVDVKPAVDINGAKLAFVVIEDGVTGTGGTWGQHNYYAGGQSGAMGGYENLPSVIDNEVYEFVARTISPSAAGGASGLPSTMTAGSTYSATLTATLDGSWNQDSLKYVVLLIGANGNILNSDFTGSNNTGINNVEAGLNNAIIYPNPAKGNTAFLNVTAKNTTDAVVTVTDLSGRTLNVLPSVRLQEGQNVINVPTQGLANGIYMVTLKTDKGNINLKLQVIK